ncbi:MULTISPECIES: DUF6241 domain-containing protein [Bacillaceae]|uniref:DUF6241 domain-containing protein n=1 Tax=Bacillaceae TaxID=186817 RepID=UPI000C7611DF|nr:MULTISPECIES: DUF6241 domain-containing protein [Bacillaceae]PLR67062.1 hypothetical protein CYJ36_13825 [Bacillus sp. UMB0893]QNG60613.1 hypothetical protein H4O14_03590 [Bacillus sp. PAMC26568]
MNWMKQHKILTGAIFILACCAGITFLILNDMILQKPVQTEEQVSKVINESADKLNEVDLSKNPFQDGMDTISEDQIQKYLHGMSHQKVEAKDKWSHYEITEERILYLIKQIESDADIEHSDLYLDILSRWLKNDFSRADKDHNAIWSLQGGTIGKATGILSEEEEMQYLTENEDKIK